VDYCPVCGKSTGATMKFCPGCGRKLAGDAAGTIEPERPAEPEEPRLRTLVVEGAEPTYYTDEDGVRITATRLIVPGKSNGEGSATYAMANITSIKSEKDVIARIAGVVLAIFGVILIAAQGYLNSPAAINIGIALLVLGFLIAVFMRPTYHLKITSASGEVDALKKHDKQEFERILSAINEALIKRG